jgi:hypothetical protein
MHNAENIKTRVFLNSDITFILKPHRCCTIFKEQWYISVLPYFTTTFFVDFYVYGFIFCYNVPLWPAVIIWTARNNLKPIQYINDLDGIQTSVFKDGGPPAQYRLSS